MLTDRKIDWIQWGRRHYYLGPLGLNSITNLKLHVSHVKPNLPKSLERKSHIYRSDYFYHRTMNLLGMAKESLDYGDSRRIDLFHKKVKMNIQDGDILYTLANSSEYILDCQANVRIHDQVGCLVALAELSNKYMGTRINVEKLFDKEKKYFHAVDLIVCPSEIVRDYVLSIAPEKKTTIVRYPIRRINSKVASNIFDDGFNALYVGRIEIAKGIHTVFELARRYPKIKFHCVGQVLMDVSSVSSNVYFYGKIPHAKLSEFYNSATFLLFPSLSEGSATVTQEAMAYGLPGIVSYQSGSHYSNDLSGFVLDAYDVEEFSRALNRLETDPSLLLQFRSAVEIQRLKYTTENYNTELQNSICATVQQSVKIHSK